MKIQFDDRSYIEIKKENEKVVIIISAKDQDNTLKKITNAVEITIEEFKKLISEI